MLRRKKIALAGVSILLALLVSACGQPQVPAANQVNQLILTDQEMNQSLKEIVRHEREDMELYGSILSKGKNRNSNLEALLDQADGHISERRTLLEQAEAVMSRTKEQMEELRTSLDELSFEKKRTWLRLTRYWINMSKELLRLQRLLLPTDRVLMRTSNYIH
ncbi:YkyA family protein [Paenibacillus sp. 1A_MP2]|uniref:YkyA family protein n=1 Tax=Paenibacillus sp. 1A_MP2 TaxID=3457495 RepID=UPI003FCE521E